MCPTMMNHSTAAQSFKMTLHAIARTVTLWQQLYIIHVFTMNNYVHWPNNLTYERKIAAP